MSLRRAILSRPLHRVAISNGRLIALDERGVTFRYKDYRHDGPARYGTMTLSADEFIRRFLLHVLPKGFHRTVTTDCSPAPPAKPISRAPESSSPRPCRQSIRQRNTTSRMWPQAPPPIIAHHALVAAAA